LVSNNYKDIAYRLSKEKGLDEELIKSMVVDAFQNLKTKLTSFDNLRYSMTGLLTFYHRQVKLDKLIEKTNNVLIGDNVSCELFHYESPELLKERLDALRDKYTSFINQKKQYKQLRDGIITLDEIKKDI
jgi:hypothetical protein